MNSGLISIETRAFEKCTSLTNLWLPDTVSNIADFAFWDCGKLTQIFCWFPEGSVSGQPWGATNAAV